VGKDAWYIGFEAPGEGLECTDTAAHGPPGWPPSFPANRRRAFFSGQNAGVSVETGRLISGKPTSAQEEQFERSLRPGTLAEYVGQGKIRGRLERIRDSGIDFFSLGLSYPVRLFFPSISSGLSLAVSRRIFHQYEDERSGA